MPKAPKGDDPGTDPVDTPGWSSGAIDPMAFKHLSDMSSQGISMVDLNGAIYYANATLRAKLGLAPDETLESHNFFEFYTTAEQVRLREEVIPGVLRDGQWTGELRLLSRAGDSRRVVQNVFLVRGGNSPQAFANVITDITHTEAVSGREQQLLQAQAIAHLGHWTSYAQTGELEWSDEIYRIFGHEPGAFVPSQARFFEAVHPDDLELVTLVVEDAFKRGEVYRVDHRIVRPDGETRWVRDEAQVEFDAEGRPLRLTGTVQDITERKQIEEALIDARDEAERASRAKSEFLSHVSHELRTPLNAILGFAQLLELDDATLTADQRDGVQQILHGGRLLLELIDGLLELGRIEAGRVELVLEKHDARDLIEECIRLVTPIAENAGVTIRFRRPESQIMVRADRTRFKEVVLNLLANAVTSNHPGGWVAVAGEPDGDQLRLSIRDNGAGIAPEDLPQLFEPFSRLNSRPGGEPLEGAGLGLPIARRL
ncbi:MAG: PAS domain-containing protein, partial [Gammaproteobacteria bacterium]|nr:PAS domain-containing protein [Gammaproteobacteria bacterium]